MADGKHALIVEDDARMARLVRITLERGGYSADWVANAADALANVRERTFALIVLDLGLPDRDGIELCGEMRAATTAPIIILTARAETEQRIKGLDAGADDYITKPFSPEELLARARAVVRRSSPGVGEQAPAFACGELTIDFARGEVLLGGSAIHLSRTEYQLLKTLAAHEGKLLLSDDILTEVWGPEYRGEPHLVWIYISRLRKKLGDRPERPRYIHNQPGIGYRFLCARDGDQLVGN